MPLTLFEFAVQWRTIREEMMVAMRAWRLQHPKATLRQPLAGDGPPHRRNDTSRTHSSGCPVNAARSSWYCRRLSLPGRCRSSDSCRREGSAQHVQGLKEIVEPQIHSCWVARLIRLL